MEPAANVGDIQCVSYNAVPCNLLQNWLTESCGLQFNSCNNLSTSVTNKARGVLFTYLPSLFFLPQYWLDSQPWNVSIVRMPLPFPTVFPLPNAIRLPCSTWEQPNFRGQNVASSSDFFYVIASKHKEVFFL